MGLSLCRGKASAVMADRRSRILMEIVTSEKKYLTCLRLLETGYKIPMERMTRKLGIKQADVSAIFGNLTAIIDLHTMICREMEKNLQESPKILAKHSSFFLVYVEFSNTYLVGIRRLQTLQKKSKKFREFLATSATSRMTLGSTKKSTQLLDISSYLIMPIQRLPRYELLLRELLSHTPGSSTSQRRDIEAALVAVGSAASKLNETKRSAESSERLGAVYKTLKHKPKEFKLLAPGRVLLHESPVTLTCKTFRKKKNSSVEIVGKSGYLFLCSDIMVLFDTDNVYLGHTAVENVNCVPTGMSLKLEIGLKEKKDIWLAMFPTEAKLRKFLSDLHDAKSALMKNLQSRQQAVEIGGCGVDPGKKKQGWGTWFSLLRWEGQKDPIYEALLRYEKLHRPPRVITFGEINLKEIG
ncbi:hypothetical protein AAMO2058_001634600, partial [Amorphochlora amoebiformis]